MNEMIRISNLSFGYKKTSFCLENINIDFNRGETAVLMGRNGSGKTTLSKLMIGMLEPDTGDVLLQGRNLKKNTLAQTAKSVGYLFQNPERQFFCSTALEEVMFSLRNTCPDEECAKKTARELLAEFSIEKKEDSFPLTLSEGEKRRLALLTVFAMKPSYYILDEPSIGLDKDNKQELVEILLGLKQKGFGLCIITHDAQLVKKLADRQIVLEKGRVTRDEKT